MIRVVLADDHTLIRQGLRQLLEREYDIEVVGEAANGQEAIFAVASVQPDVIVMDVMMPVIDGIEATRRIRSLNYKTQVIMLSMHSNEVLIQKAMANGASGYVLKNSVGMELVQAIRTANAGLRHQLISIKKSGFYRTHSLYESKSQLTSRELQILHLIASGQSSRQISKRLRVSVKTVANHRTSLMAKLNVHSLTELMRAAIKLGLINLEE